MSYLDDFARDLRQPAVLDAFYGGFESPSTFDPEAPTEEDLRQLAFFIDNRTTREDPVKIEYFFSFPEAWAWTDQRSIVHDVDELEWSVPIQGYSAGIRYKRTNIGRPTARKNLPRVIESLGPELWRLQMRKLFWILSENPLTADGANLYSAAHAGPGDRTYDNILATADHFPADLTTATHDDARNFLQAARNRVSTNLAVRETVRKRGKRRSGAIIVRHPHLANLFDDLAHEPRITFEQKLQSNPEAGTFEVFEAPEAKDPKDLIQFIDYEASTRLPVVFWVLDKDPENPEPKEPKEGRDDVVDVISDIQFGMKPGFGFAVVNGRTA